MENKRLGKRPQRRLALKLWRMLKWTVISFSIVCALTVALFLGLIAYLSRNTCDDTAHSPVVRNSRAHTAEGQVQVCTVRPVRAQENYDIPRRLGLRSH